MPQRKFLNEFRGFSETPKNQEIHYITITYSWREGLSENFFRFRRFSIKSHWSGGLVDYQFAAGIGMPKLCPVESGTKRKRQVIAGPTRTKPVRRDRNRSERTKRLRPFQINVNTVVPWPISARGRDTDDE
jgi:hypothetical protein